MVRNVTGKDVYGPTKKFLVKKVMVKIINVNLNQKMEKITGFTDLLMISINISIPLFTHP